MCGRYRRKSDKQRIAEVFSVQAGLDELDLAPTRMAMTSAPSLSSQ